MKEIILNENNYVDRDVSWMYFNNRVLKEAQNKSVPLFERLNFLGIYSNNLDEFYRVRVASLKRISLSKGRQFKLERQKAKTTLSKILALTSLYDKEFNNTLTEVLTLLKKKGVHLVNELELDDEQVKYIKDFYIKEVDGYINPIIITRKADLSDVNDSRIYFACKLEKTKTEKVAYALIPLPVEVMSRFVTLPDKGKDHYVMYLDDVIRLNLSLIFKELGYDKISAYAFKVSKDAEMEVESDPEEGLLQSLTQAIKTRKKGNPVRAVFGEGVPDDLKKKIMDSLDIAESDLILVGGRYHNSKDLMKFPTFGLTSLKNKPWPSFELPEVSSGDSLLKCIQEKDFFLHVPYQSFDAFIKLLQEAAISPNVLQIKACIYRAAKDSKVVRALRQASRNGKKVTCMVELMARFDESSNISISQRLIDAGVNVLTGAEGFKVHGKIVYIQMKNGKDVAVVSTGNFHEGNARLYTDCLLFTSNKKITSDVNAIFKFIAKPFNQPNFRYLFVSPNKMEKPFEKLILQEVANKKKGLNASICIKINHITDEKMVKALYYASSEGVKIKLLVRGNCSLVPGIPGLSDNIEIHGIIDRYLEHSRLFIFENGGSPLYFMGSSDFMPRNLYNRIEVVTPVFDKTCQKRIQEIFDLGFMDNTKSFIVDGTGLNKRYTAGSTKIESQEEIYKKIAAENN